MQHDEACYPFIDRVSDALAVLRKTAKPANDVQKPDVPSWDEYFHAIAQMVATRSKDECQVGAVIVGEGHTILSTGFNGFARGVRETTARTAEEEKLFWVTHAESNAIFNAARHGVSLVGSTLYVNKFPCAGCAQAIIQAGITRVFTYGEYWIKTDPDPDNRWEIAPSLFADAHVSVDAPLIRKQDREFWTRRKAEQNAAKRKKENPG